MRESSQRDVVALLCLAAWLILVVVGCGRYQAKEPAVAGKSAAPARSVRSDDSTTLSVERGTEFASVKVMESSAPEPSFGSAHLTENELAPEHGLLRSCESETSTDAHRIPSLQRFFPAGAVSVSGCCHLLLYYGRGPTDIARFKSSADVLAALTDENAAIATFGSSPFIRTRTGLRYHMAGGSIFNSEVGEAHRDQCLSTFALIRLDLQHPIKLRNGSMTLADLLAESVANVSLEQRELPWTAIALATYLPPKQSWRNRFDQDVSFSQLTRQLIQRTSATESCGGTHIIQALLVIDRADEEYGILDQPTRAQLASFLLSVVQRAVANQQNDGSWNLEWLATNRPSGVDPPSVAFEEQLLLSGHIAELLTRLPPERRPTAKVYQRAAEWLTTNLLSAEVGSSESWICPYTHGALAVRQIVSQPLRGCKLSGVSPFVSSTREDLR